jgi:hypothetical protein
MHGSRIAIHLAALASAFSGTLACAAHAQPKPPDFTGTWKLLPALSTGPVAPGTMTLRITGNATRLVIHRTSETAAGASSDSMVVHPGAPAHTDSIALFGSVRPRSVAGSWRGDTLVIVSAIAPDQGGRVVTERWTLDASGRRLAILTTAGANEQALSARVVLERQPN